ncbi:MAG: glycosyltransferase family 2 protein [Candidatus Helarchaeota archaeon]
MDKNPLVSIIILTNPFRPAQLTIDCLKSLENQEYKNFEIIVVDNGSASEEIEKYKNFLKTYKITHFLILNKKNWGYAEGNNIGIRRSKGDIICLLNNDTECEPNFISECVKALLSRKNYGICCPKIVYYDYPDLIWYAGGKISPFLLLTAVQQGVKRPSTEKRYNIFKETDYACGTSIFIKKEVIDKIGLLDKIFFMYYEETDWNCRAKKLKYKIVYVPNTKVYHKLPYNNPIRDFQYFVHCRNRFLFAFKNFNFIQIIFFLFTQLFWVLIELFINFYKRNFIRLKILALALRKGFRLGIKTRKKTIQTY